MSDGTERDVVRLAKVARAAVVEQFGDEPLRRTWNAQRGLVQRIQPNTLFRGGELTRYGRYLLQAMGASALRGPDIRWALSWLSDLYDDAWDMGEVVELRESNTPEGLAGARYGHIAYRVLGGRMGEEQRMAVDAALPA